MSRVDDIFARLRTEGRTTLIPFVTAGYPSLEATEQVVQALAQAGCEIIELGIPFSDPIADGPVIAASMHEALNAGVTPEAVFELVGRLRRSTEAALVAMVSQSIVGRQGSGRFVAEAATAGFDGVIIPDLDLESPDAAQARAAADEAAMSFTCLVAPTTSPKRAERIAASCRGFVYLLARAGITGERDATPEVGPQVKALRKRTELPIAVGFGISRPEQVAAVTAHADAAIVGSALVRRLAGSSDPGLVARDLVETLSAGLGGIQ